MPDQERIPYCRQSLGEREIEAVVKVLQSGWITRGPLVKQLESRLGERLGASHAIACSNGSAAIEVALRGLGIGPGDHVIVPTLTWVATASAIRLVGAQPIFCDVDSKTHGITPESVQAVWTPQTKAVIAVDMCGQPCDIRALRAITSSNSAFLIEDAAHSLGAYHDDGKPVGADGVADVVTFSFHPAKTITTAEGGLLTCQDPQLAERLRRIRSGGITRDFAGSRGGFDFQVTDLGSNYHLSELHAAIGLVQVDRMDAFVAQRRRVAADITKRLSSLTAHLELPRQPEGACWNLYVVQLRGDSADSSERDALLASLSQAGIAAHLHYPLLHSQPLFANDHTGSSFPVAERYERRALTLPLFPELTTAQIDRVAGALEQLLLPDQVALRP
jgi:UDP-4-amino-4-deoxy-L-arabinose-oxoglutarate aminotransferase